MATVTGLTAERMLQIEAASVVDGELRPDGHLVLTRHDETEIDAGSVTLTLALLRDMLYPVGVIYMSTVATTPAELFGGTWVAWGQGRVPVGIDPTQPEFDDPGGTGGEKTHLLTAAESGLPSHNHTQNAHTHVQNAHNHVQDAHNHTENSHAHSLPSGIVTPSPISGGVAAATAGGSTYGFNYKTAPGANALSAATATNVAATATNQAATAVEQSTTATNNANAAASAASAHNNLQPYVICYMWKRTA